MAKKFAFSTYDNKHMKNLLRRAQEIGDIFSDAAREGVRIGEATGYTDPNGEFAFDKYPAIKQRVDELLKRLHEQLLVTVVNGNQEEWLLSVAKNDALVDSKYSRAVKRFGDRAESWQEPNLEALEQFNTRKERGMNLSDRVWNLTDQFKGELELALELGLGDGKSAASLSKDVRKYLNEPHKLFRRVRNEKGQLRLSKAAAAYHPGQGVYRSSYKNALRLTATENNMAYRTADHERWNKLDFVIGIEIRLSNNHPVEDICNELCGVYPKTFKFVGWHPFCRCAAVPKLADEDEFIARQQALIDGKDVPQGGYAGEVTDMPECFNNWVQENAERIETAKNQPYFIQDNRGLIDGTLKPEAISKPKRSALEVAAERHSTRTRQQIDDIKRRYWIRWEPDFLTEAEKNANIDSYLQLEKELGVKRGRPMNFIEANEMRGNPNYLKDKSYRVNCQTCVMANELRRRGFNIEALANTAGSALERLSYHTEAAWLDKDGNPPSSSFSGVKLIKKKRWDGTEYTALERVAKNRKQMVKALESDITEDGRYNIKWDWARENSGHIITMERTNGVMKFYDPQNGRVIDDFVGYINGIDTKRGIRYLRVDNLRPNAEVGKNVLTKPTTKVVSGDAAKGGTSGDYKPEYKPLTSPELKKRLAKARSKQEKMKIFNDIARNGDFVSEFDKERNRILVHPGHKTKDTYWPHTKQMGLALSKNGKEVIFLPESDAVSNADAIMIVKGYPQLVDFKYSATTKPNTLQQHLAEGFGQANTIVLKLENMDAGQFRDTIEYMKRNEMPIGNIILLNKYDKIIELNSKDLGSRKYRQKIRGFLK